MAGHVRKRHKPDCAQRRDSARRCNCDGSWQARIPDPRPGASTAKLERTFRTKREAEAWLTTQTAAKLTGDFLDPRRAEQPFSAAVTEWRASWNGRLSPTTARRYESVLDNYLLPTFGSVPVGRIDHAAVQRYVDRLAGDPKLAPGTVRNVYAVLRTAMAKAVRLGWIKANPCVHIDLPRARRQEMLFLTAEEVRAVAEAIDAQYRVLIYTAAYTGLRAGELAGLQRQDVDLLRGVIHVQRAIKDVNGHLVHGPTKTHAQRIVSLPRTIRDMLNDHLAQPSPGGTGPTAPVFCMKGGGLLRQGAVLRYFRRAAAGYVLRGRKVPGVLTAEKHAIRFHDLRHTCAALSIAAGAHPKLISARLGHSSITVTLDRYGHLFPAMEALADALEATIRRPESAPDLVASACPPDRGEVHTPATG